MFIPDAACTISEALPHNEKSPTGSIQQCSAAARPASAPLKVCLIAQLEWVDQLQAERSQLRVLYDDAVLLANGYDRMSIR